MSTVHEIVTEKIIAALEKGEIPWRKPWKPGDVPRNAETGRPYHGINAILLSMSEYPSNEWITYEGAKRIGANVRKGEHGTLVTFWKISKYTKETNGETEEKTGFILRYYTVFNVAQLDNYAPKAPATPAEFTPIESAENIANGYFGTRGPKVTNRNQDRACYMPTLDQILMPTPEQFNTPEEYYSVLFHEGGHSTGHPSRLNRFTPEHNHQFGSEDYSKEELVAELTSAFVCAECGISNERTETNNAAYIQSWIKALKNDTRMIVSAASKATHAADFILATTTEEESE
jgi:antirestriction protein ArdC